jgi:small subunit ribosomal protein S20
MANTPQAKKRIRRNSARTLINKNRVSRIRTLVKKVENAVAAGDKAAATAALATVARKYSRLTKSVNAIA